MHTITHFFIGVIIAILFGFSFWPAFVFIATMIIIDLDHIFDLPNHRPISRKRYIWNIKEFSKINYKTPQKSMHLFHTFEVLVILGFLSFCLNVFFWIALGIFVHLLTDAYGNIINRNIGNSGGKDWIKYWFLTYYLIKGSLYNSTRKR